MKISITTTLALLLTSALSFAYVETPTNQSEDDRVLEQMVNSSVESSEAVVTSPNSKMTPTATSTTRRAATPKKKKTMKEIMADLKKIKATVVKRIPNCKDDQKFVLRGKYVLTSEANGDVCRIYDLSFPNLKAWMQSSRLFHVPVRQLKSRDYINWMRRNFAGLEKADADYRKNFNPQEAAANSWTTQLRFRDQPPALTGSQSTAHPAGLPISFDLSQLDLGTDFRFDAQTMQDINAALADVDDAGLSNEVRQVTTNPESALKKIRFNWNDVNKVYDVVMDGSFLPIAGPVAVVDFQKPYRFAVEKMVRSMMASSLQSLARKIPYPLVSSIVEVIVEDSFEQLELMYQYQMNLMESNFRPEPDTVSTFETLATNKAINLMYGTQADFFMSYIMSLAQGQEFNWAAFEKIGRTQRYAVAKQRDIIASEMNSRLALEKKCQTTVLQDYFTICTQENQKTGVYSLISERKTFSKSFGAPLIYRFKRPSEVTWTRGGTWVLSIALRVFGLPISRGVTNILDNQLKSFMKAGITDEAFLRNSLAMNGEGASLLAAEKDLMLKWLYIQNLNPFLPKSAASESRMIEANKKLLGMN